jgi:outer membrane protein TolC
MNNKKIMKKLSLCALIMALLLPAAQTGMAQTKKVLTLDDVLELAATQSTNALIAKQRFRSSYWQYRSFKAEYLPSLSFSGTAPSYSTAYEQVYTGGEWKYIKSNLFQSTGSLSLSQNIGLTGGSIAVNSSLGFQNNLERESKSIITEPLVNIRLTQPILKYNSLKWQKKTQPLQYEIAKKTYLSNMEAVNSTAVQYFFQLAQAQINVQIAETNQINSDTLYRMSEGRYQLGTIAEDELLQMKLTWLNSENNLKQARMNLTDLENRMRTFLGFNENVSIELIIPYEIPNLQIDPEQVLALALENNPQISQQELTLIQSESNVAQARAQRGFSADLTASYGLSDQSSSLLNNVPNPDYGLPDAYKNPSNSQTVRLTLSIPILDWGRRKGNYLMARSSLELAQVQAEQTLQTFESDLLLDVEKFNLQYQQVMIAAQSDTVAQRMYEVSKARYMIGSSTVLELNNADTEKDSNRRAYIQSLQQFWNYFYNIRSLALYDFLNNKPLEADYEALIQ